jgi:hypothetical protein
VALTATLLAGAAPAHSTSVGTRRCVAAPSCTYNTQTDGQLVVGAGVLKVYGGTATYTRQCIDATGAVVVFCKFKKGWTVTVTGTGVGVALDIQP